MKEQISRFSRGIFEYDVPVVELSENSIEKAVDNNTIINGEVKVFSSNGMNIEGMVYSGNKRVIINTPEFSGTENTICYEVNTDGCEDGDEISGRINVVSNGGEISLPFVFRVETNFANTSLGKVRNMFHFTNLAQSGIEEALKLFQQKEFSDVFFANDLRKKGIYEGLVNQDNKRHALEEFLISVRKKNRINIYTKGNLKEYTNLQETIEEKITVIKDSWGYINGTIECDAEFLKLAKNRFSTEDFVGSILEVEYLIDKEKLRQGNNYARITIKTIFQTIKYTIIVKQTEGTDAEDRKNKLEQQQILFELMNIYFDFRTRKINIEDWTPLALKEAEKLRALDGDNVFYKLLCAQIFAGDNKSSEAKWLIDSVSESVIANKNKYPDMYAYLLYIRSLCSKDIACTKEAVAALNDMYNHGHNSFRILWMLFYLDKEYENKSLKLTRIKEQYKAGCHSPVMYLEAANIIIEQPALLRVFNSFEIQVVNFMLKHGMMNERLLVQILDVMMHEKKAGKLLIGIAEFLYKVYRTDEALNTLCTLLIRMNVYGRKYFSYFEEAIKHNLKITRLYDYYMMSVDDSEYAPILQQALMYYIYNSSLDVERKAYLYANVISNRSGNETMFRSYSRHIEKFAYEMAEEGRIDQNLAVIYNTMIEKPMISKKIAQRIIDILFSYKVKINNGNICEVVVIHKELKGEKCYPVVNGVAYITAFTEDPVILFKDSEGKRYGDIPNEVTRLFEDEGLIKCCNEQLKDDERMIIYNCERNLVYHKTTLTAIETYKMAVDIKELQNEYRIMILENIVNYYYDNFDGENVEDYILTIDCDVLKRGEKIKIIESLIIRGYYEKAYELLSICDYDRIEPKRLLKLCTRTIRKLEYDYDENLMPMCAYVFFKGKYDEVILEYLIKYYKGTTKEMLEIWQAARDFITDTYELDERLIVQMMFAKTYTGRLVSVFDEYYGKGAKNVIVTAYLAYNSYLSFVREKIVPENTFVHIENMIREQEELPDICILAYLKEFSTHEEFTNEEKELISQLLDEMTRKKYMFSFYKNFKMYLNIPYSVLDKTIVEYRTNPGNKVIIHYMTENDSGDDFNVVEMNNVIDGIFTKEFTLFYNDTLQYYITEESEDQENITESQALVNDEIDSQLVEGRFEAVNDMIATREMHDDNTLSRMMHNYVVNECLVKQLFKPL